MERTPLLSGGGGQGSQAGRQGNQGGLPAPNGVETDHPIFLRACHSPWPFINQQALIYIRGAIVTYLLITGVMAIDWKTEDDESIWQVPFQFSSVSYFLLLLYHLVVFFWTVVHLHWPETDEGYDSASVALIKFLSPPEQRAHSSNRFFFSLFYSVAQVFAFMNTLIFWTVLVPKGEGHLPGEEGKPELLGANSTVGALEFDLTADGWFKPFNEFNLYIAGTLFAFLEIFVLNSIKRQVPVPSHIFGLQFAAAAYLGWAAIGIQFTGHYPYFWLNPEEAGSRERVFAYCVGFIALAPGLFSLMYGLIGMRDSVIESLGFGEEQQSQN